MLPLEADRVDRATAGFDLKVQVRTSGLAAITNLSNGLSSSYLLTGMGVILVVVPVRSNYATFDMEFEVRRAEGAEADRLLLEQASALKEVTE